MTDGDPTKQTASGGYRARRFRTLSRIDIDAIPQLRRLSANERVAMTAVAAVLPFAVNDYVLEELIDWSKVPDDPIYQLTFPQPEMLAPEDFARVYQLVRRNAAADELREAARAIQSKLNPHPAGQLDLNVPMFDDQPLPGV